MPDRTGPLTPVYLGNLAPDFDLALAFTTGVAGTCCQCCVTILLHIVFTCIRLLSRAVKDMDICVAGAHPRGGEGGHLRGGHLQCPRHALIHRPRYDRMHMQVQLSLRPSCHNALSQSDIA